MDVNASQGHRCRELSGGFGAASFAALVQFATRETLPPALEASALCFSFCIIPLTLFCGCIWPDDATQQRLWIGWVSIFWLSLLMFAAGAVSLVWHFGQGTAIASLTVSIFLGVAALLAQRKRSKNTKQWTASNHPPARRAGFTSRLTVGHLFLLATLAHGQLHYSNNVTRAQAIKAALQIKGGVSGG